MKKITKKIGNYLKLGLPRHDRLPIRQAFLAMTAIGLLLLVGCQAKTNDGLIPTQPSYTGGGFLSPLNLYDGSLAAGVGVDVYLPAPYDASVTILFNDTTVTPVSGHANMVFAVGSYSVSGNPGANWAAFALLPLDNPIDLSSGGYTQMSFYARATASASVNVNGGNSAVTPIFLTTSWQPYTIALGSMASVGQLFIVGMAAPNEPAPFTVYVNDLRYQ
jgi:hypothetical protein